MLRLKIAGLENATRAGAVKRSLNLVAGVSGVQVDAERGEVHVTGDPAETLLMVHLANEGFEAEIVRDEETEHPKQ